MAQGARRVLGSDVGLAFTGVAGPDNQDGHAPGTVFIGWSLGAESGSTLLHLPGDRPRIRAYSAISGLDVLRRVLDGQR
jgi:nicotinamide mononucleotide (NMN) deamidase PncC